jgi:hypothetical protein
MHAGGAFALYSNGVDPRSCGLIARGLHEAASGIRGTSFGPVYPALWEGSSKHLTSQLKLLLGSPSCLSFETPPVLLMSTLAEYIVT